MATLLVKDVTRETISVTNRKGEEDKLTIGGIILIILMVIGFSLFSWITFILVDFSRISDEFKKD